MAKILDFLTSFQPVCQGFSTYEYRTLSNVGPISIEPRGHQPQSSNRNVTIVQVRSRESLRAKDDCISRHEGRHEVRVKMKSVDIR